MYQANKLNLSADKCVCVCVCVCWGGGVAKIKVAQKS